MAYLEKRRTDKLRACGILIQRMIRGWFYRKRYVKLRLAVVGVQRFCRGYMARRKAQHLRETRSVIIIQKHIRGFLQRRSYTRLRQNVLRLQTYGRGFQSVGEDLSPDSSPSFSTKLKNYLTDFLFQLNLEEDTVPALFHPN